MILMLKVVVEVPELLELDRLLNIEETVTVSLRAISTLTGEVLMNVQTRKTILSMGAGFDVFRFVDMDTQLIEYEDGEAKNESGTVAVRAAIEAAVVAMIKQGEERGYWKIQYWRRK